jgi:putative nucleotidyltransferase with HDIG domain
MIDIQKALKEYNNYAKKYDIKNEKIALKVAHMLSVKEASKAIAKSLNLSDEDIELAELIGLLHDIGRFEQIKRYNTFVDKKSVNHGELGVKILFEEGLIRNFIADNSYDEIIKKAIFNHNRSEIEEGLNERELLHAKIVRDADKIDILYMAVIEKPEVVYESDNIEKETFTNELFNKFINNEILDYSKIKTHADIVITHFKYIFNINFKYSFQIINEKQYLEKLYNRIHFEDSNTQKQFETIYNETKNYLLKVVTGDGPF